MSNQVFVLGMTTLTTTDYPTHDGTCMRNYLHILDLASGHPLARDAFAPGLTTFDNCPTPAQP